MRSAASLVALSLIVVLGTAGSSPALAVSDPDLYVGDVAQWLVPTLAFATTFHFHDSEGRWQFASSLGTTVLATEALKQGFNNTSWGRRPNGGEHSFPSGHTSSVCSAGFFLQRRYGWEWGAPALAVAAFTGYSRVDEDAHHWRDVIAGCALGWGAARLFVDRHLPGDLTVLPVIGNKTAALRFEWRF